MDEREWLAGRFERERTHLRGVAFRMLGSLSEADDAVQETWLRLSRAHDQVTGAGIADLRAWLTTVLARVCLNQLRSRQRRRESPLEADAGRTAPVHVPDPIVGPPGDPGPEEQALLADAVGTALLVVLDSLTPAERLAFVLHDMFAVPFQEIAPLVERSPEGARQLASRARRRVRDQAPVPDADPVRQREVVDAFFAASRDGDLDALVAVLHPDVVLRSDGGPGRPGLNVVVRGAGDVAGRALTFGRLYPLMRPARVNGAAGAVVADGGTVLSVMAFTVSGGRVTAIDALADPERLARLGVPARPGETP